MARQLTFDLPARPALRREDFFVSDANRPAVLAVDDWRNWLDGKLALIGPPGAGKSHLARVWAAEADAAILDARALPGNEPAAAARPGTNLVVEDADRAAGDAQAEAALFHLHNVVLAEGGRLLLTASAPPAAWGLTLPDLASRMQGTLIATLGPPDDDLLAAVLLKLFSDRQIAVPPDVIHYLVHRMDRSFDAARALVALLDEEALARRQRISRSLAAEALKRLTNEERP